MPRNSLRMRRITWLKKALTQRLKFRFLRDLFDYYDEDEDDADADLIENVIAEKSKRYHQKRTNYRKSKLQIVFDEDLNEEELDGEKPWLNDREFLQKYRMSRDSFSAIHDLIKDNDAFADKYKSGRKQASSKYQLLVLLKYLGTEGNGASNPNLRNFFGIGEGTAGLYRDRAVEALLSLQDRVITWPNVKERSEIAQRFETQFNWRNCVGIMDGTLFPLAFRPRTEDAPDYSGRKHAYSLSALIVCDDRRRIRYINAGWPGTAHDNRIFKNSRIYQEATTFFCAWEYLLGDSAFENTWFCVSSFKKPRGGTLPREQELFNDALKSPRVLSEHCIGILKGRFPFLRSIRNLITEDKEDLKRILKYVSAAAILHNLLIEYDDEVPDDWIDFDDFSEMDDPNRAADDELDVAVPVGSSSDERCQQLMRYHAEYHIM